MNFLESDTEEPFFLYYCTTDPHRGGGVVEENKFKPDRFGNREEGYEGVEETFFSPDDVEVPPYLPDTPECRAELAQYYQSVARMDQGIGLLFEQIKKLGKWENTVIIYISDNGIAFPGAKTNIYQAGINLPCIVKYHKKNANNVVSEAKINWADLTPTILDIAGLLKEAEKVLIDRYNLTKDNWDNTANETFHGRSFKSVLEGNYTGNWNETYASHTFHEITMYYPMRTVIDGDFKLIWNIAYQLPYPHSTDLWASATWQGILSSGTEYYAGRKVEDYLMRDQFELYELSSDPNELNNLADNEEYSIILRALKEKLKSFQARTNDPWIAKWIHE
jgi:N-sulfoglucosamine sulfohydrolase